MGKSDENGGYSKLSINGREVFIRAEFDQRDIHVSSFYNVLDPISPLSLTIKRVNESSTNLSITSDITVKVEETDQKLDLTLTHSMPSSSDEWSIRLDSFLDIFSEHTVYICAVFICKVNVSAIFASLQNANKPVHVTTKRISIRPAFKVFTCTIDAISPETHRLCYQSKELLSLHSPFFCALFYEECQEKRSNHYEIRSIEGETFDICTAFDGLMTYAIYGNFSTMMFHEFILADRYCMERVKSGLVKFMIAADITHLPIKIVMDWIKAADATGSEELMTKLVEHLGENPPEMLECFRELNDKVSADTRLKIFEKLYTLLSDDKKMTT